MTANRRRSTAGHKTAGVTGRVLSSAAYVLTRSRAVYAASEMYGAELISGYGRDMELEAGDLNEGVYIESPEATPRAVLEGSVRGELSGAEALQGDELKGYTAIATANGTSKRVAAIDLGRFTYLFEGQARDFAASDAQLLAIIQSFRALHPQEKSAAGGGRYVRYMQVPRGADMASLAAGAGVADAESYLRLINDFYPRGEPRTGDWIKVIR